MNDLSKELLEYILVQPGVWDKKTGKLDHPAVLSWMEERKEVIFYYEVYWPRVTRMTERLKKWNWCPSLEFEIMETDWAEEVYWPADELIAQWISDRIDEIMEVIWNNDKWATEEPSEAEMLSLNIHPPLVATKVNKGGGIQPSMF